MLPTLKTAHIAIANLLQYTCDPAGIANCNVYVAVPIDAHKRPDLTPLINPLVDATEAEHGYKLSLCDVVAVGHDEFRKLYDVKYVLPRQIVDRRI